MNIIHFKELDSTNAYAKNNIEQLNDFDVIVADHQNAGYGQWGRKWIDTGSENLYMTIVIKPEEVAMLTNIVRFTAICTCNVLLKYNTSPKIKEPNDILINNKKICGILAESISRGDKIRGLVVGIGINLNANKKMLELINQPSTSLNLETQKKIDKNLFLKQIVTEFKKNYPDFIKKGVNLNSFL